MTCEGLTKWMCPGTLSVPSSKLAAIEASETGRYGVPNTAVVSASPPVEAETLKRLVKEHLAGYKAPKHVVFVDEVYRSPSGKADFKRTKQVAMEALGIR